MMPKKLNTEFGLPEVFCERFTQIYPDESIKSVFGTPRGVQGVRVNAMKSGQDRVRHVLHEVFEWEEFDGYPGCGVIPIARRDDPHIRQLCDEGRLYFQDPASMAAVWALDPQPHETVWDCCAAPGSKLTHISALMKNSGCILATEKVKNRFYKMKHLLDLYGVECVEPVCVDARGVRHRQAGYDRILVDAPCSSDGRFRIGDARTWRYWSERKIREMRHKQKGLLKSAIPFLKPGGVLVYSTCTSAPEENEQVVHWCLKRFPDMRIEPFTEPFRSLMARHFYTRPGLGAFRDHNWGDQFRGRGAFYSQRCSSRVFYCEVKGLHVSCRGRQQEGI
jgi:16S rRNA C967 or C1407 C5-methylase (RsmB/RsmF family)